MGTATAIVASGSTHALGVVRSLGRQGVPVIVVSYDRRDVATSSRFTRDVIGAPHPEEEEAAVVTEDPEPSPAALVPASSSTSVLGIGLIVGALMVFLGVGMLLRLRSRNRRGAAIRSETQALPTGFYSMPDKRRR